MHVWSQPPSYSATAAPSHVATARTRLTASSTTALASSSRRPPSSDVSRHTTSGRHARAAAASRARGSQARLLLRPALELVAEQPPLHQPGHMARGCSLGTWHGAAAWAHGTGCSLGTWHGLQAWAHGTGLQPGHMVWAVPASDTRSRGRDGTRESAACSAVGFEPPTSRLRKRRRRVRGRPRAARARLARRA